MEDYRYQNGTKHFNLKTDAISLHSTKGPWKFIQQQGNLIFSNIRYKVGNGGTTLFWIGHLIRERKLMVDFPLPHSLSIKKNASVADLWNEPNRSCTMNFRRNLKEDEIEEWPTLSALLSSFTPSNRGDLWLWNLEKHGYFTTKSLTRNLPPGSVSSTDDLYKSIWKATYPRKVKFLLWELSHSCFIKFDKLQRRCPW